MQPLITVVLSDGAEMSESKLDLMFWRKVLAYAKPNGLKIKSLTVGGRAIDINADWYFIIGQGTSFRSERQDIWERGVGSVRLKEPRTRIEWYDIETNELRNVRVDPGAIDGLKEFGIEREK